MNRDDAQMRAKTNEPITDLREVVFVLAEQQRLRTAEGTPAWYHFNRLIRDTLDQADAADRMAKAGGPP